MVGNAAEVASDLDDSTSPAVEDPVHQVQEARQDHKEYYECM
jgi:hypothetical protein